MTDETLEDYLFWLDENAEREEVEQEIRKWNSEQPTPLEEVTLLSLIEQTITYRAKKLEAKKSKDFSELKTDYRNITLPKFVIEGLHCLAEAHKAPEKPIYDKFYEIIEKPEYSQYELIKRYQQGYKELLKWTDEKYGEVELPKTKKSGKKSGKKRQDNEDNEDNEDDSSISSNALEFMEMVKAVRLIKGRVKKDQIMCEIDIQYGKKQGTVSVPSKSLTNQNSLNAAFLEVFFLPKPKINDKDWDKVIVMLSDTAQVVDDVEDSDLVTVCRRVFDKISELPITTDDLDSVAVGNAMLERDGVYWLTAEQAFKIISDTKSAFSYRNITDAMVELGMKKPGSKTHRLGSQSPKCWRILPDAVESVKNPEEF